MHDFITIDTETGGLYPSACALLSIAAVAQGSAAFQVFITPESQPGKIVTPEAVAKNCYSPQRWRWEGAVPLEQGFHWFLDWLEKEKERHPEVVLVCHNLAFDRSFLSEAERVTGREIPHRSAWRCSQVILGDLMDLGLIERGSSSLDRLGELSGFFGPHNPRHAAHDALQDARATAHGYTYLMSLQRFAVSPRDQQGADAATLPARDTPQPRLCHNCGEPAVYRGLHPEAGGVDLCRACVVGHGITQLRWLDNGKEGA